MFTARYGRYIPVHQVAAVAAHGPRPCTVAAREPKTRTARYIPVRQLIGTRISRYRVVALRSTVNSRFPSSMVDFRRGRPRAVAARGFFSPRVGRLSPLARENSRRHSTINYVYLSSEVKASVEQTYSFYSGDDGSGADPQVFNCHFLF
ncbi:hypothetical protein GW17_00040493 [Ensete ventricosum]|nr:hypothetical protein GW17_00040493 [Ensete ventricosum]